MTIAHALSLSKGGQPWSPKAVEGSSNIGTNPTLRTIPKKTVRSTYVFHHASYCIPGECREAGLRGCSPSIRYMYSPWITLPGATPRRGSHPRQVISGEVRCIVR